MTKLFIAILFFISTTLFSQSPKQGMKILLREKTKGDTEILVKNTNVIISLNDSIKHPVTTNDQGLVSIETPVGKFSVTVAKDSCQTVKMNGIIVGENKTAYLIFALTCPGYINSLTKKELKELGLKRINQNKK